nr:hypothetical protein [Tanacetum cinerariifolium]
MRTHSSSNLPGESSPNLTSSNPKRRNRRRSKQPFILEESPVDTMADQRTMAEFLCAPTEGYAEAIVVPSILAEQFKLKHSLINMMTSDQFYGLEKDNPHDHIRWFNKNDKSPHGRSPLLARKRTPHSILTWEDLVSKFINEFFPPPRTTNLCNEISNFQQRFDVSFHEAWDQYKDLLRACPHHGFTELHQLDTFYNALNPADQDSLNPAVGGNLLEKRTQDVLTIIENKSKVRNSQNKSIVSQLKSNDANSSSTSEIAKLTHAINQQTSAVTTAMTAILKQFQETPPPAFVKSVEEICVTCGGAHPYYQCLAADGNTFPELRDNIQGYVSAAASNYNQGNSGYRPPGASINLMPLSVWKKLGLPKLISTRMTLELDNRAICTPARITRDVFVPVGKFTFPAEFVIVDYENDHRISLILGRPFLRTARALIDVHGEEMILRDGDERLTLNIRHDISSYSNQPKKESINMINIYDDSCKDFLEYLFATNHQSGNPTFSSHLNLTSPKVNDDIFEPEGDDILIQKLINLDFTKDLPLPHNIYPLSGNTTSSSPNHLLEEYANELALITFPLGNDDLPFDIESDLKEIEYLLNHDPIKKKDSILEDLIDASNLTNLNDNLVDTMPEMFTDEHALDYSSPPLYDEYDDDLFEVKSSDFLPSSEYDLFLFEDFFEVDALPSNNNEDKVFNLGILIQENLFEVITRVSPDKNVKKISISHASLILKDFDPPLSLYELPFHKEVPRFETLLLFSSKNEEKVFKTGILASKGVHSSLILELSHRGYKVFKIIIILESPMEIFPCFCGEDICILDVPCLHFYPP